MAKSGGSFEVFGDPKCCLCFEPAKIACGGCGVRTYCGRRCQIMDWQQFGHASECQSKQTLDAHFTKEDEAVMIEKTLWVDQEMATKILGHKTMQIMDNIRLGFMNLDDYKKIHGIQESDTGPDVGVFTDYEIDDPYEVIPTREGLVVVIDYVSGTQTKEFIEYVTTTKTESDVAVEIECLKADLERNDHSMAIEMSASIAIMQQRQKEYKDIITNATRQRSRFKEIVGNHECLRLKEEKARSIGGWDSVFEAIRPLKVYYINHAKCKGIKHKFEATKELPAISATEHGIIIDVGFVGQEKSHHKKERRSSKLYTDLILRAGNLLAARNCELAREYAQLCAAFKLVKTVGNDSTSNFTPDATVVSKISEKSTTSPSDVLNVSSAEQAIGVDEHGVVVSKEVKESDIVLGSDEIELAVSAAVCGQPFTRSSSSVLWSEFIDNKTSYLFYVDPKSCQTIFGKNYDIVSSFPVFYAANPSSVKLTTHSELVASDIGIVFVGGGYESIYSLCGALPKHEISHIANETARLMGEQKQGIGSPVEDAIKKGVHVNAIVKMDDIVKTGTAIGKLPLDVVTDILGLTIAVIAETTGVDVYVIDDSPEVKKITNAAPITVSDKGLVLTLQPNLPMEGYQTSVSNVRSILHGWYARVAIALMNRSNPAIESLDTEAFNKKNNETIDLVSYNKKVETVFGSDDGNGLWEIVPVNINGIPIPIESSLVGHEKNLFALETKTASAVTMIKSIEEKVAAGIAVSEDIAVTNAEVIKKAKKKAQKQKKTKREKKEKKKEKKEKKEKKKEKKEASNATAKKKVAKLKKERDKGVITEFESMVLVAAATPDGAVDKEYGSWILPDVPLKMPRNLFVIPEIDPIKFTEFFRSTVNGADTKVVTTYMVHAVYKEIQDGEYPSSFNPETDTESKTIQEWLRDYVTWYHDVKYTKETATSIDKTVDVIVKWLDTNKNILDAHPSEWNYTARRDAGTQAYHSGLLADVPGIPGYARDTIKRIYKDQSAINMVIRFEHTPLAERADAFKKYVDESNTTKTRVVQRPNERPNTVAAAIELFVRANGFIYRCVLCQTVIRGQQTNECSSCTRKFCSRCFRSRIPLEYKQQVALERSAKLAPSSEGSDTESDDDMTGGDVTNWCDWCIYPKANPQKFL